MRTWAWVPEPETPETVVVILQSGPISLGDRKYNLKMYLNMYEALQPGEINPDRPTRACDLSEMILIRTLLLLHSRESGSGTMPNTLPITISVYSEHNNSSPSISRKGWVLSYKVCIRGIGKQIALQEISMYTIERASYEW